MKNTLIVCLAVASTLGCGKPASTGLTLIVPYGRENNSGTYMYFKEHVLAKADFANNVQTLPGTAAVINAVSKDKNSIGYGGIAYAKGVKALKVKKDAASAGVEPTMESVVTGSYPISRYLFFYTVGELDGAKKHFIEWLMSPEGQKICEAVGYYPVPEDKRLKSTNAPLPGGNHTITIKGSDTMVIVGQRWAETYMKAHPEVIVQITGGGSGTGIAALINGSTDICQASRPMTDKEKDQVKAKYNKGITEVAVAMDGLAIFVHDTNPIQEITLDQLKDVYTGKFLKWSELAPAAATK